MNSVYHAGELQVQQRAGVLAMAEQTGRSVRTEIPKVAADFLAKQTFLIASTGARDGQIWTSALYGPSGFIEVPDPNTMIIRPENTDGDPFYTNLSGGSEIGLLAIELTKRRRMRMNGQASLGSNNEIIVKLEQVYSNCPKYIQARAQPSASATYGNAVRSDSLNERQIEWIAGADTFFIGTSSGDGKCDASHRGGAPGFIQLRGGQLWFPDYFGNAMFNTLGNIQSNPNTGLLFIDFDSGSMLHLSGKARIVWDEKAIATFSGAERLVVFEPEAVIERAAQSPSPWSFISFSPFNPKQG